MILEKNFEDVIKKMKVLNAIRNEHKTMDLWFKERWNRSLPFAEEIGDRWERAKSLGFGNDSSIYDSSVVLGSVTVGQHTWIGPNTILDGSGGLSIGSFCSISAGVQIYTHDSILWAISGGQYPCANDGVVIEDRCYIAPNTVITKGVTIGMGSIVGAMSLVKENVPISTFVAGVPARVKGKVSIEDGRLVITPIE